LLLLKLTVELTLRLTDAVMLTHIFVDSLLHVLSVLLNAHESFV
jgi:hypothetical protein